MAVDGDDYISWLHANAVCGSPRSVQLPFAVVVRWRRLHPSLPTGALVSSLRAIPCNTRLPSAVLPCRSRTQRRVSHVHWRTAERGNTATRAAFGLSL